MEKNNHILYKRSIIFGFIILISFYLGFIIGKNAAQRERQNTQIQKQVSNKNNKILYLLEHANEFLTNNQIDTLSPIPY